MLMLMLPIPRPAARVKGRWFPLQSLRVDPSLALDFFLFFLFFARFEHRVGEHYDVLTFLSSGFSNLPSFQGPIARIETGRIKTYRVPQHVQILQRVQHIRRRHRARRSDILYADPTTLVVFCEDVHDRFGPVCSIPQ